MPSSIEQSFEFVNLELGPRPHVPLDQAFDALGQHPAEPAAIEAREKRRLLPKAKEMMPPLFISFAPGGPCRPTRRRTSAG